VDLPALRHEVTLYEESQETATGSTPTATGAAWASLITPSSKNRTTLSVDGHEEVDQDSSVSNSSHYLSAAESRSSSLPRTPISKPPISQIDFRHDVGPFSTPNTEVRNRVRDLGAKDLPYSLSYSRFWASTQYLRPSRSRTPAHRTSTRPGASNFTINKQRKLGVSIKIHPGVDRQTGSSATGGRRRGKLDPRMILRSLETD
jgi:hypothetical protein